MVRHGTGAYEAQVFDDAAARLQELLGDAWRVTLERASTKSDQGFDFLAVVSEPSGQRAVVAVEAKRHPTPYDVKRFAERARHLPPKASSSVFVGDWLSRRARELLDSANLNYLDLTGNISIRIDRPAIVIKTEGAERNPAPPKQGRGLSGVRASRLVRELVDSRPPRRTRELAVETGLSEGYVSRLLDVMTDEALITRGQDRAIADIDWVGLLRARASHYRLMKAHDPLIMTPRLPPDRTLSRIATAAAEFHASTGSPAVLATGQHPATAIAPLAVGGNLMLYVKSDAVRPLTKTAGLLPTERTTDFSVLLLIPRDDGIFDRPWPELLNGLPSVGLSQLVLDCLGGPGRLPEQAEALLTWMTQHEERWRRSSPLTLS